MATCRNLEKHLRQLRASGAWLPVRDSFEECPACAAKPGSPLLCAECLERRALYGLVEQLLGDGA